MYYSNRLSIHDLAKFLNGTVFSEPFGFRTGLPVGNLQLEFTLPSVATVTFPGAPGAILTGTQIVAAINASITGLAKVQKAGDVPLMFQDGSAPDNKVRLEMSDDAGVTIDPGSTALPILKVARLTGALVAATDIIAFSPDAMPGYHWLITKDH